MADIVLINPRFAPSYWGLNYAMPLLNAAAVLPVINLPLLAALTPPEHMVTLIDEKCSRNRFQPLCARRHRRPDGDECSAQADARDPQRV
jgi:hypothetical protein